MIWLAVGDDSPIRPGFAVIEGYSPENIGDSSSITFGRFRCKEFLSKGSEEERALLEPDQDWPLSTS
jgi:hypothetical protein